MNRDEYAAGLFSEGFNCAQAVLASFRDMLPVPEDTLLKIACGFGGGMGRLQETCGAVSGAFMVLGLLNGNTEGSDSAAKEKTYELVRKFADRFRNLHSTINCRELLGCDLQTDEGKKTFKEKNLMSNICTACVRDAVKITESMIK